MADALDLAQQLAFYKGGGQPQGSRTLDKINAIFGTISKGATDYQDIIKQALENKKAQIEQSRVGGYFAVPDQAALAKETAQNQLITNRNAANVPENVYPQPTAAQENAPVPGQVIPIPIPTPTPVATTRSVWSKAHEGLSSDTPIMATPELLKVAALTGLIPTYKNKTTGKVVGTTDPAYAASTEWEHIGNLKPSQVATMAQSGYNKEFAQTPQMKKKEKDVNDIADGIMNGSVPAAGTELAGGMGGLGGAVIAELGRRGFDYKSANLKWLEEKNAIVSLTKTMNQPQMVRLQNAFNTVQLDIPAMQKVSDELDRVGFVPANKLIVNAALNGVQLMPEAQKNMNQDQISAAIKYTTQINLMRDNLAISFSGGGVPTESSFKLADGILNPFYSSTGTDAALTQVGVNMDIRNQTLRMNKPVMPTRPNNPQPPPPAGERPSNAKINAFLQMKGLPTTQKNRDFAVQKGYVK